MESGQMDMNDPVLVDSINYIDESARGKIVVSGSHGGVYPAYKAAAGGARAVILNDAGFGFHNAGVACLEYCERIGMAAVVIAHSSARIGDSKDMFERGIVSGVNKTAEEAGCREGMKCEEAVNVLGAVSPAHGKPPAYEGTRFVLSNVSPRIVCIDSASLVSSEDAGQIVVTGSHGGLIGGKREKAFNVDARITVFNDAGVGIDEAGIGRLDPLQSRGIAAITVSHATARIGDSRSTYNDGVISHVNSAASELGAQPGGTLKSFIRDVQSVSRNR